MDISTMSILPRQGHAALLLNSSSYQYSDAFRWPDKICSPTSSLNWLAKKPSFASEPWHFSILVPCASGKTKLVWEQFIWVIWCYPENGAATWNSSMWVPSVLRKAAGAGSSVTSRVSSTQVPGVTTSLSQSSYQQIQVWAPPTKASLGWILDRKPSSASLNALLAAWTLLCCRFDMTLGVLVDPKPLTSWSLLIPGKHGGPPWSSNTCCPRYPSPAHLWPQHHSLHPGPCLALHVSLCHQTSVLSPLLP